MILIDFLRKIFAPSTDRALKGFQKAHRQLEKVVAFGDAVITATHETITECERTIDNATERRDRAARIASKVAEFVA